MKKNAINEASLKHSRSGFKNITQSFIIATNDNQSFLKTGVRKVKPAKKIQILTSIFKLEDITRAHYMIKLRSQSIEKISLSMNFVGKIECFDFDLNKSDETRTNPHSKIVVRSNQVKLLRYNKPGDADFNILVTFNNMENIQTIRLFILAALITYLLTKLLRLIGKILGILFNKGLNRTKCFIYNLFHKKKKTSDYLKLIQELSEESSNEIPDHL